MKQNPVTEIELHAWVDAALTPDARAHVESLLAEDAQSKARVDAWQAQKARLHTEFDPVLDEPLPLALQALCRKVPVRPGLAKTIFSAPLQRLAAAFVLIALGALTGWFSHGQLNQSLGITRNASLPHQAAVAHAVFSPDAKRPVEISAEHEDQLVKWLSKRLGAEVHPPKLGAEGFELIGGRLLPGEGGPVAQFMYQDASGQRLTLYLSHDHGKNRDAAFRFAQEGTVNVFYWIDGQFGYALSASIPKDTLARIATVVYDQLDAH